MEPDDPMTMGVYWLIFLVDIFLYAIIMWYIDSIKPGTFGVGRNWYFPFEVEKYVLTFIIRLKYTINLIFIYLHTNYE